MYGWRARIGSIGATPTDIFPYEFYQILPDGFSIVQATLTIGKVKEDELSQAYEEIKGIAVTMAQGDVDIIVLGGAPMVFMRGPGSDRVLSDEIGELTGVPILSNQTAMMDGLKSLGCRRILVASPFVPETNAKLKTFLEGSGFEVVGTAGLGLVKNADINKVTRQRAYHFLRAAVEEHRSEKPEGVVVPCAHWPTSLLVDKWERDLDIPVVTSNLAKIWAALQILGIKPLISGYGRLLGQQS